MALSEGHIGHTFEIFQAQETSREMLAKLKEKDKQLFKLREDNKQLLKINKVNGIWLQKAVQVTGGRAKNSFLNL